MIEVVFKLLIEAKNKVELNQALSDGAAIETLRSDCARELKMQTVPASCFRELNFEHNRNLVSFDEFLRKTKSLTSFCKRVARESGDFTQLRRLSEAQSISSSCRSAIKKRSDDLEYQIGEVRDLDRFLN